MSSEPSLINNGCVVLGFADDVVTFWEARNKATANDQQY